MKNRFIIKESIRLFEPGDDRKAISVTERQNSITIPQDLRHGRRLTKLLYWVEEHMKNSIKDTDPSLFSYFSQYVGWVARDRLNNALFLHNDMPYRSFSGYQIDGKEDVWESELGLPLQLDDGVLSQITWDSEPLKVKVEASLTIHSIITFSNL